MEEKTGTATKPCCEECSNEAFSGIASIIDLYKDKEGSLIQVLHHAQELYGYLPLELQSFIADGMGIPLSEVSGVVTFYSFFSTKPRGKHTIRVCMGTACYVRGGKKLVETLQDELDIKIGDTTEDGLFTFEVARCIGACGLAPAIMIDDTVYKQVNPNKLRNKFFQRVIVESIAFYHLAADQMLFYNGLYLIFIQRGIKHVAGGYQHHRPYRAGAHAAGLVHQHFIADAGFFRLSHQRILDNLAVGGHTARPAAHIHNIIVCFLRLEVLLFDIDQLF